MSVRRIALLASVFLGGCGSASATDVERFRSGLVCLKPNLDIEGFGDSSICLNTEEIIISGQSSCTFDNSEVPCTWYGFEFSFSDKLAGKSIKCTLTTDKPVSYGGPTGIRTRDISTHEYDLTLPKEAGRFFNPQFAVFRPERREPQVIQEETTCSSDDRELFRFRFRFVYPATNPKHNE